MKYKKILGVRTVIANKRSQQLVVFKVEDSAIEILLAPGQIKSKTNLEITEFDVLNNCFIYAKFYRIGDTMWNGEPCKTNNLIIEDFDIKIPENIPDIKVINRKFLLDFQKISETFIFRKFGKINVGLKTTNENTYYINFTRLEKLTGLNENEIQLLVGSFISPEFYNKGDIMYNGLVVKYENTLKDLNLRLADDFHKNYNEFIEYSDYEEDCDIGESYYQEGVRYLNYLNEESDGAFYWNID